MYAHKAPSRSPVTLSYVCVEATAYVLHSSVITTGSISSMSNGLSMQANGPRVAVPSTQQPLHCAPAQRFVERCPIYSLSRLSHKPPCVPLLLQRILSFLAGSLITSQFDTAPKPMGQNPSCKGDGKTNWHSISILKKILVNSVFSLILITIVILLVFKQNNMNSCIKNVFIE